MNINQAKLFSFLAKNKKISNVLIVEDYKNGVEAEQVFKYLKLNSYLLVDFLAEHGDDLRSYRDELQQIGINLDRWFKNDGFLIVPVSTASKPLPIQNLRKSFKLNFGEHISKNKLSQKLEQFGYLKTGAVLQSGEFSISSQRIDIFPFGETNPYRISISQKENLIEKIKIFSPSRQLQSEIEVEFIYISPLIFAVDQERNLEIIEDIQMAEFNSLSADINSFGLWFLNEKEKLNLKDFINYNNLPHLSDYSEYLKIELENINKKQSYQHFKTDISLDELGIGDYIVHLDYGIGIFEGLTREKILGGLRDFIKIKYAGDQNLLLPIEKLDILSRYISASGGIPKLDKLGGGGFLKRQNTVRDKLSAVAKYIVEISAQRQLISAPKINIFKYNDFIKDAGFLYTEDQTRSINEILEKLSFGFPMDHLLIGDVGFGKTEVALNIIYQIAKNNLQTAFLVPTTLLARQHYQSSKRLEKFGIKIAHLDKFVNLKERKNIINKLENGEIDLIIGTTAILDLKFKNLAFFIIDEEHKFGVKQKNQLQMNYGNVHLLSMSATPIPRTLHSALSKLKTISKLETAPKDRKGVKTRVIEYDEVLIKNAILRELNRNGQIFYIFNSIAEIENKKKFLLKILPHLKILILHSEIHSNETEKEIFKFEQGEYNMLLSTSIISSGIHIPNANTIIIDGADRFGIADLHQLRGRVGRGEREGYSFFVVESRNNLTESSVRRLLSLEENSSLGSGNNLAMHDLEIRGGGNIAGESQSGHIDDVGYSLYVKLLEQQIIRLSQDDNKIIEQDNRANHVDIRILIDGYISPEFIPDERARLDLYRRIALTKTIDEVNEIKFEIKDRFGNLDENTDQYLDIVKIKLLSKNKNIQVISNNGKNITFSLEGNKKINLLSPTRDNDDVLKTIIDFLKKFN